MVYNIDWFEYSLSLSLQRQAGADNDYALEKKWISVMRLQRKVMDLEKKLSEVQKEVAEGGGATRKSRLATDWIPRPPERYEAILMIYLT